MDAKLAAATPALDAEKLKLQPAKDKVAADAILVVAAEKAMTDGSPLYSNAAYTMLKAIRLVRTANEATILAK